jgi:hypothetical protein
MDITPRFGNFANSFKSMKHDQDPTWRFGNLASGGSISPRSLFEVARNSLNSLRFENPWGHSRRELLDIFRFWSVDSLLNPSKSLSIRLCSTSKRRRESRDVSEGGSEVSWLSLSSKMVRLGLLKTYPGISSSPIPHISLCLCALMSVDDDVTLTVDREGGLALSLSNLMLDSLLYNAQLPVLGLNKSVLEPPSAKLTSPPLDGGRLLPSDAFETLRRSDDDAGAVDGRMIEFPLVPADVPVLVIACLADGGRKRGSKLSGVAELGRHPRAEADGRDPAATALVGLWRRPDSLYTCSWFLTVKYRDSRGDATRTRLCDSTGESKRISESERTGPAVAGLAAGIAFVPGLSANRSSLAVAEPPTEGGISDVSRLAIPAVEGLKLDFLGCAASATTVLPS